MTLHDTRAPGRIGTPTSRIDGPLKVTGAARYAAEFPAQGLLHGVTVWSAIAHGAIRGFDEAAARAVPGLVEIFTHANRPATAWFDYSYRDEVAPPGSPFRPLASARIDFAMQPVALVVAETFEAAQEAAALLRVDYAPEPHRTSIDEARADAYVPPKKRTGIAPPPDPKGDADAAMARSAHSVDHEYRIAVEHHNPMEPHASTVVFEGPGKLTIHDKTQGVQNSQAWVASIFSLNPDDVRVVTPFVGGAFGSGLRPQHQLFLAVMAALALSRSVRVVMTRDEMFSHGYRPDTIQRVGLACDEAGHLTAIRHEAVAGTSQHEDYQENVVNWSNILYPCENVTLAYKLAKLHTATPADMRAPGAGSGVQALEMAMDELAEKAGLDPIALRLRNYASKDETQDKAFTSKELRACLDQGARRFGWDRRRAEPGTLREGRERIGLGMACGAWEAFMMKTSALATFRADGTLEVACATMDVGTGTYTILAQVAADTLGLPLSRVTVRIGDSTLPSSPVQGGSWTAASAGSAVRLACEGVAGKLLRYARRLNSSPLGEAGRDAVDFADGAIVLKEDESRRVPLEAALAARGKTEVAVAETASPSLLNHLRYASYAHAAVFAEVRVDEELGVVRVARVVSAVAAGRILNPKTARSQILGGVVFGIGMALHEETRADHRLGRFMTHNFADYHIPSNADVRDIEVIFVDEADDKVSPLGVKGLGEIGLVGTAAAIANAIYNATGRRVRHLPITLDKLL